MGAPLIVHVVASVLGLCAVLGGVVETSSAVVLFGGGLLFVGGAFAFISGRAVLISPLVRLRIANAPSERREALQRANAKMMGTLLMTIAMVIAAIVVFI